MSRKRTQSDRNYEIRQSLENALVREFNFATGISRYGCTQTMREQLLHPTSAEFSKRLDLAVFDTVAYKKLPDYMKFSLFSIKNAMRRIIDTAYLEFYYEIDGVVDTFEAHRDRFLAKDITDYGKFFTNNNSGFYWIGSRKPWFISSKDSSFLNEGSNND